MINHMPLVRNQTSQPTSVPRETRRRRVMSRGLSGEVGEGDVSNMVEVGVLWLVSGKCAWRKISRVWAIVQSVRHARGMVGNPIRLETAGL